MSALSRQLLPRHAIEILRSFRHYSYIALSPFDYVARAIKGKADFPPLYLRGYVGPLPTFESSGTEFMGYLRLLLGLQTTDSILDIGCGCGLMAILLKDYLHESGHYTGIDIHKPSIRWCAREIGKRHANFHFEHVDVRNRAFNPKGRLPAEDYVFPFEAMSFDVILVKSVFTHMRPAEIENYLREMSRILKPDGRCLVTFFLLNEEQARLTAQGTQQLSFSFGDGPWRYVYSQRPESAVAYDENYIRDLLPKSGLVIQEPIHYGTWTGRSDGLSFQDILLLRKQALP